MKRALAVLWWWILLGFSTAAFATDPSCDTSWTKTATTWTCNGNGQISFSTNTDFIPGSALTLIANNGFSFNKNQIGSSSARVNLQSAYGIVSGKNSVLYGNISASSAVIDLTGTDVYGTITTSGNIDLQNGLVSGKVTSTSNSVTANGTTLQGGVQGHSGIDLKNGSVTGSVSVTAANDITLHNMTMPSGSISGANNVYIRHSDLGSATSLVNVTAATNNIYIQNASTVYGNLTAAGSYGYVYVKDSSDVFGICLPNRDPANACQALPVASVHHYELQYTSPGLTCEASTVAIKACSDASCSSLYSGAVSVTLSANNGATWSNSSPVFSAGSASSAVRLTTPGNTTIGISSATPSASSALVCKNAGVPDASCSLTFADTGLKIVHADNVSNLDNQVAGVSSTAKIRAVKTNPTTGACQARVQGTQAVGLAFKCINPSSCVTGQQLTWAGASLAGTDSSASPIYSNVNLTFDSTGTATTSWQYSDVGQIALHARLALAASGIEPAITLTAPAALTIVKPYRIVVSAVSAASGSINNPATTNSGSGFLAAGTAFKVQLTVQNAALAATPNFGKETTPEALTVQFNQLVYPTGGVGSSGTLLNLGSFSAVTGFAGHFANSLLYFQEAGSFNLFGKLADNDYLGAGAVAQQPVSATIGRFYPQHFELSSVTYQAACATPAFSYLSQSGLQLGFSLKAMSQTLPSGNRVLLSNYDSDFYSGAAAVNLVAENDGSVHSANLQSRLSGQPTIRWRQGEYLFQSGANLQLGRQLAVDGVSTVPDGPFLAMQFGVRLSGDLDNRNLQTVNMNAATAGVCSGAACDAAVLGPTQQFYYGRLLLDNIYSDALQAAPIVARSQYWDGLRFITQANDNQCTTLKAGPFNVQGTPNIAVSGSDTLLVNGQLPSIVLSPSQQLKLAAPGQDGSWQLQYQAPVWLKYNWQPTTVGDENPSATALFGRYRGNDRLIYWREQ